MRIVYALALVIGLSSCSLTAPRDVGKANMITLSAPVTKSSGKHTLGVLKVDYPSAPDDLNTYRIAVAKADGRQDYIASARWNEFLPSVLQSAITETLAKNSTFSYVESDEGTTAPNYLLHMDIEECRVVYGSTQQAPDAVIRIVFNVKSANSKKLLKTFTVEKRVTSENNTLTAISRAFNHAFADIATDMQKRLKKIS